METMINNPIPVLSTLSTNPSFGESLSFLLAGFSIVMLTLLALAIVCGGVGALFRTFPVLAGKVVQEEEKPKRRPANAVDDALLAVISAAVDQSLGGRYRIKSVKPLGKK